LDLSSAVCLTSGDSFNVAICSRQVSSFNHRIDLQFTVNHLPAGQLLQIANCIKYLLLVTPIIFIGLDAIEKGRLKRLIVGFSLSLLTTINKSDKIWSPFLILWAICYIIAALYAEVWDVRYDWGLTRKQPRVLIINASLQHILICVNTYSTSCCERNWYIGNPGFVSFA